MVTQLYTAPLKAYMPNKMGTNSPLGAKPKQGELSPTDDESGRGNSSTLAAIKEQAQKGTISIQSIVTDFQSTMSALGVTDDVRSEVAPYLQVVAHQATKSQPSSGLIKQNLKAAADTLDQYITGVLGQKSNVVREWVDALLMQPIEYHSDTPIDVAAGQTASSFPVFKTESLSPADAPDESFQPKLSGALSKKEQEFIKNALHEAKFAVKNNETDRAMELYQSVLATVGNANYPELKGRVYYQMGRTMDRAVKLDLAKQYYEKSAGILADVPQPGLQAKVYKALGTLHQNQGETNDAIHYLRQSLELEFITGNESSQAELLNQLGRNHVRLGQKMEATVAFEEALEKAQKSQPKLAGHVLGNLGALSRQEGKKSQAFAYYKQSLQVHKQQNNKEGMKQSLQSIASLYLEAGKPDKALKALQNALYRV